MGNNIRSSSRPKALAPSIPMPPLADAMDAVHLSVDRFCLLAGVEALAEMMEEDATTVCGARHRRHGDRRGYRWGRTHSEIGYHGGKVTETLMLALEASGCNRAEVVHKPRLLSDNGSSYIAGDLADWLEDQGMDHVRGAPNHPQTQSKIERWHQTLKNRILLENYVFPRPGFAGRPAGTWPAWRASVRSFCGFCVTAGATSVAPVGRREARQWREKAIGGIDASATQGRSGAGGTG